MSGGNDYTPPTPPDTDPTPTPVYTDSGATTPAETDEDER